MTLHHFNFIMGNEDDAEINYLFLCIGISYRSQMAERWANKLLGKEWSEFQRVRDQIRERIKKI